MTNGELLHGLREKARNLLQDEALRLWVGDTQPVVFVTREDLQQLRTLAAKLNAIANVAEVI